VQIARTRILVPHKARHPPQSELCLLSLHNNCHLQINLSPLSMSIHVLISAHKHNIGTIGGVVAAITVFAMFAACLGFGIYRRRRNDARRRMRDRDRQVETQSVHSDVSGNSSLLPRYFPPNAPPPYIGPAEGTSVATQSDLSSITRYHQTPPPFCSTPSQPANEGVPRPLVTHDREPSDLPPPDLPASASLYQFHASDSTTNFSSGTYKGYGTSIT
jgi:hypothetical protein